LPVGGDSTLDEISRRALSTRAVDVFRLCGDLGDETKAVEVHKRVQGPGRHSLRTVIVGLNSSGAFNHTTDKAE
jgi:hypothetical protein